MGLESATYIDDLTTTNPVVGDLVSQGDDHLRLLKSVLKGTFPFAAKAFRFPTGIATTGSATLVATDENETHLCDATGGAIDLTLPTLTAASAGWKITVFKHDSSANAVTVTPASGTINGLAAWTLAKIYEGVDILWSGTAWWAVSAVAPFPFRIVSKTAGATLTDAEMRSFVSVVPTSGTATIVLPAASDGDWVIVKRNHASNNVIVDGNGAETIDGVATFTFSSDNEVIMLVGRSSGWDIAYQYIGAAFEPPVYPPQGRLTLVSGNPGFGSDQTGKGLIYYTPDVGNRVLTSNGTTWKAVTFTELTFTLDASAHTANNIYDLHVWDDAGTLRLVASPVWATVTAGAGSRGTAASGPELERYLGFLTNKNAVTVTYGASTGSMGAREGLYVGSFLVDATNAQVSIETSFGQTRRWGLWNMFNRRPIIMKAGDSTGTPWSYTTGTVRASNGDSANKVRAFTGRGQEFFEIEFTQRMDNANSSTAVRCGIGWNSTSVESGQVGAQRSNDGSATVESTVTARHIQPPALGLNEIQCLEFGSQLGTFFGTNANMQMVVRYRG